MNKHELKLATEPFEAIASGRKTIESRLFDEKRQTIQLGDVMVFSNRENPSQTLRVKVIGLLRYGTFADLFINNDPTKFGGESTEWLLNQIGEFYSDDQQKMYGVVGIHFKLT